MAKTIKNLKDFQFRSNQNNKTKSKKNYNKGGKHMSQTYSLDSLENEETTFFGLTIRNWVIGIIGFGIIGYNINYNMNLLKNNKNYDIYKI